MKFGNCPSCKGLGFIESSIIRDNATRPMIIKCQNPNCDSKAGYYQEVRRRHSSSELKEVNVTVDLKDIGDPEEAANKIIDAMRESGRSSIDRKGSPPIDPIYNRDQSGSSSPYYPTDPSKITNQDQADQGDQVRPYGPHTDQGQPCGPGHPKSSQVPSNGPRQEVEMDTVYTHLPKAFVDQCRLMMSKDPNAAIVMSLPFGRYITRSFEEANRVFGISQKYTERVEEFNSITSEHENVEVFPIDKSLGF